MIFCKNIENEESTPRHEHQAFQGLWTLSLVLADIAANSGEGKAKTSKDNFDENSDDRDKSILKEEFQEN